VNCFWAPRDPASTPCKQQGAHPAYRDSELNLRAPSAIQFRHPFGSRTSGSIPPRLAVGKAVTEPKRLSRTDDYQCAFFRLFKRTFALCTAAIFSGRFMRFHFLMSSLLRPQLTHRSALNWQTEMHGFSISLAIVNNPGSRVTAQGASANRHHECVGTPPQSRIGQCDLKASHRCLPRSTR